MTIKNSLISVTASALLISAMTGCSSGGGTTGFIPTTTTATTNPTSITATDGYVNNYTVTATYGDSNDSNISYATTATLTAAVTDAKIVAGSTQTAGSAVMDLTAGGLTATQLANLKFVTLSAKAQSTDGTTLTYGTFFDANADGKFVAADGDVLANTTFSMTAPAGYKMITPVTTLVQQRITQLIATDTNQSQRAAHMTTALTQVAAGLGLTADKIKNVDPLNTIATDPAYALINAMLGQAITDNDMAGIATSLATATAATTPSAALNNIAAGATTGAAFYTSAADQLAADSSMINSVSTWNLDALRSNTAGGATALTPTFLTPGTADINVTAIKISDLDVGALAGSGAKFDFGGLDDTNLSLTTAADVNMSNKSFKLAIDIRTQETRINDDANITSLTILVPFEINGTTGTEESFVSGTTTWEGVRATGATFTGEMNASTFNVATYGVANSINTSAGVLTMKIGQIITQIDTNSSSLAGIVDNNISSIKVAMVDINGSAAQRTSGALTQYWGNTAVASVLGGINVTGKTIINNSLVDGRDNISTKATANLAPANAVTFVGTLDATLAPTANYTMSGLGSAANPYILLNNMAITMNTTGSVTDINEANTTAVFTSSAPTILELNNTALSTLIKNTATAGTDATTVAATGSDFNSSTNTTAGDINYTVTSVFTDEFGEANTTIAYFMYDRPAYVYGSATSRAFGYSTNDANTSTLFADYDTNTTLSTLTGVSYITILENNNSGMANELNITLNTQSRELNLTSNDTNYSVSLSLQPNGTLESNITLPSDVNFTIIEYGITDIHSAELNATLNDTNITY